MSRNRPFGGVLAGTDRPVTDEADHSKRNKDVLKMEITKVLKSEKLRDGGELTISLMKDNKFYYFEGSPSGGHAISADSSEERVEAHWEGYVTAARNAIQGKPLFETEGVLVEKIEEQIFPVDHFEHCSVTIDRVYGELVQHVSDVRPRNQEGKVNRLYWGRNPYFADMRADYNFPHIIWISSDKYLLANIHQHCFTNGGGIVELMVGETDVENEDPRPITTKIMCDFRVYTEEQVIFEAMFSDAYTKVENGDRLSDLPVIDIPEFLERASTLAHEAVQKQWADEGWEEEDMYATDEESRYSEEAQDMFNSAYAEAEELLLHRFVQEV